MMFCWNLCWNHLPSLFRVAFSASTRQPRCPCPWAHWPPRWSPGHQLSPQTSGAVVNHLRDIPIFQWKIMGKSMDNLWIISWISMENQWNQETYGFFFTIHGPGSLKNCPSSRAGRVEVVGMKKYWELKPHIWVFVENGLRQNQPFPLSL